jgi:ADP-heptose:LPS heptosyltransferase
MRVASLRQISSVTCPLEELLAEGRYRKIAVLDLVPPRDVTIVSRILDLGSTGCTFRIFRYDNGTAETGGEQSSVLGFRFDLRGGLLLWKAMLAFRPDLILIPQPYVSDYFTQTTIIPMLFPLFPVYFVDGAYRCYRSRPGSRIFWLFLARFSTAAFVLIFIHLFVFLGAVLWLVSSKGRKPCWHEYGAKYRALLSQCVSLANLVYPEKFFGLDLLALGMFLAACWRRTPTPLADVSPGGGFHSAAGDAILVIRIDHLGDVLNTVPFLAYLKERFPDKRIVLLVCRHALDAVKQCPFADEIWLYSTNNVQFNRGEKRWRDLFQPLTFLPALRGRQFIMAFDPVGRVETQTLLYLSRASYKAANSYYPINLFGIKMGVNHVFCTVHESERPFFLLDGGPEDRNKLLTRIFVTEEERTRAQNYAQGILRGSEAIVVTVHPTANWHYRCWPSERFGELVCRLLAYAANVEILLLGTRSELPVLQSIREKADMSGENSGRIHPVHELDLRTVMALIARSALFIGNDSGLFHIAVAAGVPAVAIFGPGDRHRWGDYPATHAPVLVVGKELPCVPCSQEGCTYGSECLQGIAVDQVWGAARKLLETSAW